MRKLTVCLGILGLALGTWLVPSQASAGECASGLCGTPNQSGGGCGCGGGSILIAMTDRGDTYQFADDFDGDGIEDEFDNCPFVSNYAQADSDGDSVGDGCDLCPNIADPLQADTDGNGIGDLCDPDIDGDKLLNAQDNCPFIPNPAQTDTSGNGIGDVCDDDDDGDGLKDFEDPCRLNPSASCNLNPGSSECGCEDDLDMDGIPTNIDNCPTIANPQLGPDGKQLDLDGNGIGDLCDPDIDGDGILNHLDNCGRVFNPAQIDLDKDGLGDAGWGTGLPESCDPHECYVVTTADRCLDPKAAFDIQGIAFAAEKILTGREVILGLFTNRPADQHTWKARFVRTPLGSNTSLFNAESSATTWGTFPQLANCLRQGDNGKCVEDNQMRFTPDVPGDYEIQVKVDLQRPDTLGSSTAVTTIAITVSGDEEGKGCSAAAPTGLAGLALLGLLFFRRRRG